MFYYCDHSPLHGALRWFNKYLLNKRSHKRKDEERLRKKGGKRGKEEDGARAKVCLIWANLLSFQLLLFGQSVGTGLTNIYYFLVTIINCFLYLTYCISGN